MPCCLPGTLAGRLGAMPAASAPSSPAALRQWTTDVVAPPARLDYWVGAICEAFLEMDCSSREAPLFGGELQSLPVETLSINRVRASTQDVFRTPAGSARSRQSSNLNNKLSNNSKTKTKTLKITVAPNNSSRLVLRNSLQMMLLDLSSKLAMLPIPNKTNLSKAIVSRTLPSKMRRKRNKTQCSAKMPIMMRMSKASSPVLLNKAGQMQHLNNSRN